MSRSRLGIVLLIPDPPAGELDGLRRALGDPALDRIPPHVTLIAPVNITDDRVDDVVRLFRDAAAAAAPLRLEFGPVKTFWPDTPVLYVGVDGDIDSVRRLHDRLIAGIDRPAAWPFVPHVTIGQDVPPTLIEPAVELFASYRSGATIEHVHLLRQADERRWDVIADAPLGGGRVVGRGGLEVEISAGERLDPEGAALAARWTGTTSPSAKPFAVTARREGAVAGVATGSTDGVLVLDTLVVDAAVRGQGVGSLLLAEVEWLGASRGCVRGSTLCPRDAAAVGWFMDRGWGVDLEMGDWRPGQTYVRLTRPFGPARR